MTRKKIPSPDIPPFFSGGGGSSLFGGLESCRGSNRYMAVEGFLVGPFRFEAFRVFGRCGFSTCDVVPEVIIVTIAKIDLVAR